MCADAAVPTCGLPSVPGVEVARGEIVRFHLGFEPRAVSVDEFRGRDVAAEELEPRQDPQWAVRSAGAFSLFARAETAGDASYVGCVTLR